MSLHTIEDSIKMVKDRVEQACERAGRAISGVRVVAVTKTVDKERVREAYGLGIRDFGENYVQEARKKIEELSIDAYWHMIGHIQTNKVKYIPRLFHYCHAIDRWEIIEALDRYEKEINVLFELNLSGEQTKYGTTEDGLKVILEKVPVLRYIRPIGLMTMAPYGADERSIRGVFQGLRQILDRLNREFGLQMKELSMGMSNDFELAIEEGATMVRIGTAIFGERS